MGADLVPSSAGRDRLVMVQALMSHHASALAWAGTQVAAVRDDPAARLALMARVFHGPTGRAPPPA